MVLVYYQARGLSLYSGQHTDADSPIDCEVSVTPEIPDYTQLEQLKQGLTENERMQLDMEVRDARKDPGTCTALACLGFIGVAGIHRFILGKTGMGLLMLFTGGLCWVGTIIDLVNMKKMVSQYNYEAEYRTIQEFLARKRAREGTA
jgi:TM2 domain-containing membrane protein YozV